MSKRHAFIVDSESGEVVNEIGTGDRIKITRKESIEYLSQYQAWDIDNFYKAHAAELRKVLPELSVYEKAFIASVAPYIGYDDCCIKYPNGNDITSEDLVGLTGLSRSKMFTTIDSLCKKDIIYKGKNSKGLQYFINPWLFCKGNRINQVLKTMFKNYRIRVLGGMKWKDIK